MPVLQTTSNLDIFSDTDCLIPEPNGPPTNHIHIHLTPREFSTPASTSQTGTNPLNLYPINTIKLDQKPPTKNLSLSSLNVSSVGDFTKTDCILDFVTSQDLDIVALCETWLKGDASDSQCIAEFTPADYPFLHRPCPGRRGGGVGVLIHRPLSMPTPISLHVPSVMPIQSKRRSYSSSQLLCIRTSCPNRILRPLRKTLFSYSIWGSTMGLPRIHAERHCSLALPNQSASMSTLADPTLASPNMLLIIRI